MLNKVFYFYFRWNEWNHAPTFKICIYLRLMTCICYTNYYNFYFCENDDWINTMGSYWHHRVLWQCLYLDEFSFPMQLSLSIPSPQGRDWRASGPKGPKCAWPDPPISSKCFIFIDSALIKIAKYCILFEIWPIIFLYICTSFFSLLPNLLSIESLSGTSRAKRGSQ